MVLQRTISQKASNDGIFSMKIPSFVSFVLREGAETLPYNILFLLAVERLFRQSEKSANGGLYYFSKNFLIHKNVSSLMSCSILQLSWEAVSGLTPKAINASVMT